ncbi:tail fiber domain-containing protein [Candidatus Woesearchaeota archaeon]|nr:MAG: tail fiber domain-containing protein [Candidatus Woesearchaeota archaeon]
MRKIILFALFFLVIGLVTAVTPNPGHACTTVDTIGCNPISATSTAGGTPAVVGVGSGGISGYLGYSGYGLYTPQSGSVGGYWEVVGQVRSNQYCNLAGGNCNNWDDVYNSVNWYTITGGNTGWTDNANNVYTTTDADVVGIGDTTPDARLEISGNGGATDLLRVSSNDANDGDRFVVKNSGNTGVGVANPSNRLEVAGTVNASGDVCTALAGGRCLSTVSGGAVGPGTSSRVAKFNAAGNNVIDSQIFDGGGNVGLNTIFPGAKLEIYSTNAVEAELLRLRNGAWNANQLSTLSFFSGDGTTNNRNTASIKSKLYSGGTAGDLSFWTNDAGTLTQKMVITNTGDVLVTDNVNATGDVCTALAGGRCLSTISAGGGYWSRTAGGLVYPTTLTDSVGIGTSSPTQRLQVAGAIRADTFLAAGTPLANAGTGDISAQNTIAAGNYIAAGCEEQSQCGTNGYSTMYANGWGMFSKSIKVGGWEDPGQGNIKADNIVSGAYVGAGTASPTATLEVAGNQGGVGGKNFKVTFPGGGALTGTEMSGLAHVNGVWTALYAKQGSATSAAFFNGSVGVGTAIPSGKLHVVSTDNTGAGDFGVYVTSQGSDAIDAAIYASGVGNGLFGSGNFVGVKGTGGTRGVEGFGPIGIYGGGSAYGVQGIGPTGVFGRDSTLGTGWAGYFEGRGYFSQNVGIGTLSPTERLHVNGGSADTKIMVEATGGNNVALRLANGNRRWTLQNMGTGTLRIYDETAASERLSISSSGDVGIGKSTPTARLDVVGVSSSNVAIRGVGTGGTGVEASGTTGVRGTGTITGLVGVGTDFGLTASATGAGSRGVYSMSSNGIGVEGSGTTNDFYASGTGTNYGAASSIRWKSDVKEIDDALDTVTKIRGVTFTWDKEHGGQEDMGFIAEEVGKEIPEIVSYEENGVDAVAVDYGAITPVLVEAIKELKAENDELKKRVDALEKKNK